MDAKPPEKFGQVLRRMRETAGQTQERLAELAGLSARGISDIERGVHVTPRLETVHMLADGLGLDDSQRIELTALRNAAPHKAEVLDHIKSIMLPNPASSFIGRAQEIEAIASALRRDDVRLLTLIGPGGVGKTRISIEAARMLKDEYAHGAVFVDLSPISSPELVLAAIATRLGLREQPGADLRSVLQIALQNRSMLLVLDNLEQVMGAAPDIAWLLGACSRLNILVTSRVVLRIAAEHIVEIEPMPVAPKRSDAVQLFIERAFAANSQFTMHADNAEAIVVLVGRLQGMPLAIELAAARTRLWSVDELLQRLDTQLPVLAGGAVDSPDRHRSMRDTIAWSYDLLAPRDQAVFCAMSIFPMGCTMDTANAVMAEHRDIDAMQVLEAVNTLVDSSLVRPREGVDQRTRYRMLVSVREFGLDQLEVCKETRSVRWAAHQKWAEPLAVQSELVTLEPGALAHLRYLDAESQNVDEHIDWLVHQGEVLAALNLYGLLSTSRWIHGPNTKSRQNMEQLLALPQAQVHSLERLRGLLGLMSDYESADDTLMARLHLDTAEELARELNDRNGLLRALLAQANNRTFSGDVFEAERYLDEINALAMNDNLPWVIALENYLRAYICLQRGDLDTALELMRQTLKAAVESDSLFIETRARAELGYYLLLLNRLEEAEEMCLWSHHQFTEMGDFQALPISLTDLAEISLLRGNIQEARERAERGQMLARQTGSMRGIAATSQSLARIASVEENWVAAKSHLHEAIYWNVRCNIPEFAIRCLEDYARVELATGSTTFAAWCLGAVDGVLQARGIVRSGLPQKEYVNLIERVKQALEEKEWSENYDAARKLSVEQILKEVRSRAPAAD